MKPSPAAVRPLRWWWSAALTTVLTVTCAACSTPGASEHFYTLSDGSSSGSLPAATSNALTGVVITAVTVPELVDRPQIVTRDGAHRVSVAEQHLWAEPLRNGIARVLAVRLARTLADAGRPAQVGAYPQTSIPNPDYRITIDVQRFDAAPGGDAVIDALWSVRKTSDDSVRSGRTVATRPVAALTYEATVRAWSEDLEVLDRDIAAVVVQGLTAQSGSPAAMAR